jgi:hypothetical protein
MAVLSFYFAGAFFYALGSQIVGGARWWFIIGSPILLLVGSFFITFGLVELIKGDSVVPETWTLPIAAGVLTVIAACISFLLGFASLLSCLKSQATSDYLTIGIFGLLTFAFGLATGIMSLRRRLHTLTIFGLSFTLFIGFLAVIAGEFEHHSEWINSLIFAVSMVILSLLSVIFIAEAEEHFR